MDDRSDNNTYERQAFEGVGLRSHGVLYRRAFEKLSQGKVAAIIPDMGREGPREGYVLVDRLRKDGYRAPLFFVRRLQRTGTQAGDRVVSSRKAEAALLAATELYNKPDFLHREKPSRFSH